MCVCTHGTYLLTSTHAHAYTHPIHTVHAYTLISVHTHTRTHSPIHTLTQGTYTFARIHSLVFLHTHTHPRTCTQMHANPSACTQMHTTCSHRQSALHVRGFRIVDCRSIVFMKKKKSQTFSKSKTWIRRVPSSRRIHAGAWCVGRRGCGPPANVGRARTPCRAACGLGPPWLPCRPGSWGEPARLPGEGLHERVHTCSHARDVRTCRDVHAHAYTPACPAGLAAGREGPVGRVSQELDGAPAGAGRCSRLGACSRRPAGLLALRFLRFLCCFPQGLRHSFCPKIHTPAVGASAGPTGCRRGPQRPSVCLPARPAPACRRPHPHVDETSFPPRTCAFKSPGARRACPQGRAGGGWTAVVGGSFVSSQGPLGGRAPGKLKQRPTMAPSLPGRPRSRACTAASGGPCYFLCWLRGSWPAANGQEAGWASPPHLPGGPPRPEQPLL